MKEKMMLNMQKMMQQAQQVQFKMQELQEKFKDVYVQGEAAGGLVKVEMSCAGVVSSVKIDPSAIDVSDPEMLEDMVVAAINNAGEAKNARIQSETQAMMEEAGVPADMAEKLPL